MIEDERIPDSFRKGERSPQRNVGELIKELKLLPPELVIFFNFSDSVVVGVTKVNDSHLALVLDEPDEFEDDEDEEEE